MNFFSDKLLSLHTGLILLQGYVPESVTQIEIVQIELRFTFKTVYFLGVRGLTTLSCIVCDSAHYFCTSYLLTPWSRVCSQSRNSLHFMELEGSLPHSQVPTTFPYPDPA
jgi:hypothetical protein